ncbi:hypothetical protein TRIUR3_14367 [Triticum urartu]|uniref:Uncharacterized protein n=1 Tax=Triticum urartu TaxID=4572 RepID=M7ZMN7_TRIUA|nr:hypothetical protein TRIUR3_14367 [Triticum urartu]
MEVIRVGDINVDGKIKDVWVPLRWRISSISSSTRPSDLSLRVSPDMIPVKNTRKQEMPAYAHHPTDLNGRCRLGENPSLRPLPPFSPSRRLPILSRRCCSPWRRPQPHHLDTATMSASERRKAGDWALPYERPGGHLCARAIAVTTNAGGYGHASPSPGRASAAETAVHVAVSVVLAPTDRLSGADSSLDHNAGKWNGIF